MTRAPWWPAAAALLALGLALGSPWLITLGVFVVSTGAVAWLSAHSALRGVSYRRSLSRSHFFAGETVQLSLRLANDKLLPVPWIRVADDVAAGLDYGGLPVGASRSRSRRRLVHLVALRPYERVTWRHEIVCPQRGHYMFGPARLESGDLFGLYRQSSAHAAPLRLVVYPTVLPLEDLGFPPGEPFGGPRAEQPLYRDPLRPVGVRDYRPEDSRRNVHWKATARHGTLKVKVLEPVHQRAIVLVVNIATVEPAFLGTDPLLQEQLVTVAASLAGHAVRRGCALGLVANGSMPGTGQSISVPSGRHPLALRRVLESLAAVSAFVSAPIERLLAAESRRAPWGATLVVVTALVNESLEQELVRLRRSGRRVALVSLDERYSRSLPGIHTTHLPVERINLDHRTVAGRRPAAAVRWSRQYPAECPLSSTRRGSPDGAPGVRPGSRRLRRSTGLSASGQPHAPLPQPGETG